MLRGSSSRRASRDSVSTGSGSAICPAWLAVISLRLVSSCCRLRRRQLAARFLALLLHAVQFLSNAPRAIFNASRFRGIPLFARLGPHRFRFHDPSSLVRRHLLKLRFELFSLLTLLLQGGP